MKFRKLTFLRFPLFHRGSATNWSLYFAFIVFLFPVAVTGEEDVGRYYEDALKSSQQGMLPEAVIHLKNALQINSEHLPSRLLMAEVLIHQGNGAAAEAELEYAQSHGVNANRLLPLFAEAYLLQDKYRNVLDRAKPASRGKKLEAKLAYLRGRAHFGLHQLSSAYREFGRALHLHPRFAEAKLGKAQVLVQRDQVEQAALLVDEVLSGRSASANAWLLNANIQRLKGDFSGSQTSVNRAITMEPGHLAARLARAGLLMQKGAWDDAEKDIDFILEMIPLEPRAKYLKAIVSASKGDSKSSAEKIEEVMITLKTVPEEVMKNNPSYLYLAGTTSFRLGNYDAAKAFLNKYLKIKPNDFNSMRTMAIIELRTGRPNIARTILAKINVAYPNQPGILSLLGVAYMDLKRFDLAQEYFEKVVRLVPESDVGLTQLARSKIASGQLGSAIENLLQAKDGKAGQVGLNLLLAEAYSRSKQYSKAIDIYRQLTESVPKSSRIAQLYGAALGLSGDRDGARQWFGRALELDPANSDAMIHLSRMDLIQKGPDKAIAYLEAQLVEHPESYELMVELGKTHGRLGDHKASLLWFNKAFVKNGDIHYTLDGLVNAQIQSGNSAEAVALLEGFIGRNPTDAKAHTMLGRVYQLMNEPQKAIEAFSAATNFAVDKSKSLMALAKALERVDDREGAINALKKALAWDESYLAGYITLTKLVIKEGDKDYALRLISAAERLSPDTPVASILRGELYAGLQEFSTAESNYKKALDMGDSRQALLGLYQAYKKQHKEPSIVPRLLSWLKRHPKDLPINLILADAYFSSNKLGDTLKVYERLLSFYPESSVVLNNAAEIYFVAGEADTALSYARKALKKAPKNANFMDTVGWIESRTGNHQTALSLFREALAYDFDNPDVKYHLALTLDKLDRRGEAMKLLGEVIDGDRPFTEMTSAEALHRKWTGKP